MATAWMLLTLLFVPFLYGQAASGESNEENAKTIGAQPANDVQAAPTLVPFEQLMAIVVNAGLDLSERSAAAGQIVEMAFQDQAVAGLLGQVLLDPNLDSESSRLIARAVARQPVAPDVLSAPLVDLANRLPEAESNEVIAALGSIRSQSACAALIDFASPDRSVASQTSAFSALWRLTAMRSLGVDHASWRSWFGIASQLDERHWNVLILNNLAHERDQLVRTRASDIARLVGVATQLNLATPTELRSALLASYLLDRRDELRELGFDLVERELRQSSQLNGEVAEATMTLLSHADPLARRRAAQVIDQIAPPDAGPVIAQALAAELDPLVAAELLKASIRWPLAELEAPVLHWLVAGGNTFAPAARAALELRKNGLLQDARRFEPAAVALRSHAIESLSESSLALLADIGQESDREAIAALLASDQPQTSRAAALALSDRPEYLDRILVAADGRSHLLPIAADAVLNLRPTAAGYTAIAALLQVPEGEQRDTTWLLRIAQMLSIADVFMVAISESDVLLREQLLTRLAEDGFVVAEAEHAAFAKALAELAHLQMMGGRPDSALLTLDKIPSESGTEPDRIVYLRATALIATNRLDDARSLDPTATAWLDALEYLLALAPDPQLASAIIAELTATFADAFTEDEQARFTLLSEAVVQLVAASEKPDEGDPPAEKSATGSGGG